jgi:hypothetical protein
VQRWRGRFVVYDRHAWEALALPLADSRRLRLRRWFLVHLCPPPDLVLLLDAPGGVLQARQGGRSADVLEAQRRRFLAVRHSLPHLVVLNARRDADEVRRQALEAIWRRHAARWRGKGFDGRRG